jgi:hypothetical protein
MRGFKALLTLSDSFLGQENVASFHKRKKTLNAEKEKEKEKTP